MTKAEIEFLRAAGFSIAEIMAMNPAQNAQENSSAASGNPVQTAQENSSAASGNPVQTAQTPAQTPPAQAEPATSAAAPAQTQAGDLQSAMLDKLDKLLAAVQAGNRSGAAMPTPEKKSVEEIAGQLY